MMQDVQACTTQEEARMLVRQEVAAMISANRTLMEDVARDILLKNIGYLTGAGMSRAESGRILDLFETEHPYFGPIQNFPQTVAEGLALGLAVGEASKTMPIKEAMAVGRLRARQIRGEKTIH